MLNEKRKQFWNLLTHSLKLYISRFFRLITWKFLIFHVWSEIKMFRSENKKLKRVTILGMFLWIQNYPCFCFTMKIVDLYFFYVREKDFIEGSKARKFKTATEANENIVFQSNYLKFSRCVSTAVHKQWMKLGGDRRSYFFSVSPIKSQSLFIPHLRNTGCARKKVFLFVFKSSKYIFMIEYHWDLKKKNIGQRFGFDIKNPN